MEHQKIIECEEPFARCDGGDAAQGHPAVYLDLSKVDQTSCPYCGRLFKALRSG